MHIFAIWDSFKQQVKNSAIERSTTVSYENKRKRRELYKTLLMFHELEYINPGGYSDDINVTRAQLQAFETEKYRKAVVRSRTKKFLLGEQPTKRSLDGERRYALSKEILELDHKGVIRPFQTPDGARLATWLNARILDGASIEVREGPR